MATSPELIGDWYRNYTTSSSTPEIGFTTAIEAAPGQNESGANAQQATPTESVGYTPTTSAPATQWNVTPDQTVQGQVKGIIAADSPLMQQAQTSGMQYANRRGLINSSLGGQAAQEAVYKAATPIATSDATMYGASAKFNAEAQNAVNAADTLAINKAKEFGAGVTSSEKLASWENETRLKISSDTLSTNEKIAGWEDATKRLISDNTITSNEKLSALAIASQEYITSMNNQTSRDVASIGASASMSNASTAASASIAIAQANIAGAQTVANINGQYSALIQSSAAATSISNNLSSGILSIINNENITTPEARTEAINMLTTNADNALSLIGAFANVDLGG